MTERAVSNATFEAALFPYPVFLNSLFYHSVKLGHRCSNAFPPSPPVAFKFEPPSEYPLFVNGVAGFVAIREQPQAVVNYNVRGYHGQFAKIQ